MLAQSIEIWNFGGKLDVEETYSGCSFQGKPYLGFHYRKDAYKIDWLEEVLLIKMGKTHFIKRNYVAFQLTFYLYSPLPLGVAKRLEKIQRGIICSGL